MSKLHRLFNEFPPCLCRLLARNSGRALTGDQLASLSGLNRWRVNALSQRISWTGIPVDEALSFMRACGIDLLHLRRHREFIRRANWSHIEGSDYHLKLLTKLYNARRGAQQSYTPPA